MTTRTTEPGDSATALRGAAEKLVLFLEERFPPPEPRSVADTGLNLSALSDLLLKNLYNRVTASGLELSDELGLPFVGVVDQIIDSLRKDHLVEVRGGLTVSASSYQ